MITQNKFKVKSFDKTLQKKTANFLKFKKYSAFSLKSVVSAPAFYPCRKVHQQCLPCPKGRCHEERVTEGLLFITHEAHQFYYFKNACVDTTSVLWYIL